MSNAKLDKTTGDSAKRSIASENKGKTVSAKEVFETPSPNIWTEATIRLLRNK